MCDPLKLSIYSTKSLKAWALRTDVLELSTDFLSLAAACLWKWPTQSRWYVAPNAITSPSDNFPIKVLSPILWAHDLTLASKPRVHALVSFSVVPCSQRKQMSPGSVDKLLAFGSVHQSTGSSWLDWTWWSQRWSQLFLSLSCLVHLLLLYRTLAKIMPRHSITKDELNQLTS